MKTCNVCRQAKPLEEFHKAAKSPDGRQYRCKVCTIAAARQRAKDNPEAKRAADRKYSASDRSKANRKARSEGPQREKILEQKRQSRERNKAGLARKERERRITDPERYRGYRQRKYAKDRDKILAANRAWALANPDKVLAIRLRHSFGMTVDEFTQKMATQEGRCAICMTDMTLTGEVHKNGARRRGVCVDHCHETGAIRALLCTSCNKGLGYFKDDPARMRAAADYIEKHRSTAAA